MKEKIRGFIDKYVLWGIAVLGIPLTFYGAWFQTEGFTLPDAPLSSVFLAVLIGGIIGAMVMSYLVNAMKKQPNPGKRPLRRKELFSMIHGDMFIFVLSLILVYTATNLTIFFFGLAGMMYATVTFIYFLGWDMIEKKKNGNNESAGQAGKVS